MTEFGAVLISTFAQKRFFTRGKNRSLPTVIIHFSPIYNKERKLVFEGDKLLELGPTETCDNIYP
jgi:hypothetical protein